MEKKENDPFRGLPVRRRLRHIMPLNRSEGETNGDGNSGKRERVEDREDPEVERAPTRPGVAHRSVEKKTRSKRCPTERRSFSGPADPLFRERHSMDKEMDGGRENVAVAERLPTTPSPAIDILHPEMVAMILEKADEHDAVVCFFVCKRWRDLLQRRRHPPPDRRNEPRHPAGSGESNRGKFCAHAARRGWLNLLRWARGMGASWGEYQYDACSEAARSGDVATLEWVVGNGAPRSDQVCWAAAFEGHLEVLEWARSNGQPWDEQACAEAARGGHIKVLKWLRDNGAPWDSTACSSAAAAGHIDVLAWLRENGAPWDESTCRRAAGWDQLEALKWAKKTVPGGMWAPGLARHGKGTCASLSGAGTTGHLVTSLAARTPLREAPSRRSGCAGNAAYPGPRRLPPGRLVGPRGGPGVGQIQRRSDERWGAHVLARGGRWTRRGVGVAPEGRQRPLGRASHPRSCSRSGDDGGLGVGAEEWAVTARGRGRGRVMRKRRGKGRTWMRTRDSHTMRRSTPAKVLCNLCHLVVIQVVLLLSGGSTATEGKHGTLFLRRHSPPSCTKKKIRSTLFPFQAICHSWPTVLWRPCNNVAAPAPSSASTGDGLAPLGDLSPSLRADLCTRPSCSADRRGKVLNDHAVPRRPTEGTLSARPNGKGAAEISRIVARPVLLLALCPYASPSPHPSSPPPPTGFVGQ